MLNKVLKITGQDSHIIKKHKMSFTIGQLFNSLLGKEKVLGRNLKEEIDTNKDNIFQLREIEAFKQQLDSFINSQSKDNLQDYFNLPEENITGLMTSFLDEPERFSANQQGITQEDIKVIIENNKNALNEEADPFNITGIKGIHSYTKEQVQDLLTASNFFRILLSFSSDWDSSQPQDIIEIKNFLQAEGINNPLESSYVRQMPLATGVTWISDREETDLQKKIFPIVNELLQNDPLMEYSKSIIKNNGLTIRVGADNESLKEFLGYLPIAHNSRNSTSNSSLIIFGDRFIANENKKYAELDQKQIQRLAILNEFNESAEILAMKNNLNIDFVRYDTISTSFDRWLIGNIDKDLKNWNKEKINRTLSDTVYVMMDLGYNKDASVSSNTSTQEKQNLINLLSNRADSLLGSEIANKIDWNQMVQIIYTPSQNLN